MISTTLQEPEISHLDAEVKRIFAAQKANTQNLKNTTAKERIEKLKKLKKMILAERENLQKAIYADFKKPASDTDLTEIFPVLSSITHICHSLRKWMKPKRVPTPLNMAFTRGMVYYEPKGVSLIISPWNYPFQLTFDPLLYAIAAGCTAILKPSEMTPHTSAFMKKLIEKTFPENEIALLEGDASVSQALLKQPFDHIFFTGSPMLGKVMMRAAAENLTSVTLELGGKSPAIVDETTNIKDAAQKLTWGKWMNAGQTCIAPDYVLVHEKIKDELLAEMKSNINKLYGQENKIDIEQSPDYTRIVNQRHYQRVKSLLENALENGAQVAVGAKMNEQDNFISPTILTDVNLDMAVMQEEIFGPILPMLSFKNLQEAVQIIENMPKPLALYIFSTHKQNQNYLLQNTTAGGTCINETLAHIANPDLPFGGVNNSGIGKTHGFYGFQAFSNERAVLKQRIGFTTFKMLYPPYTAKKKKTIDNFSKFV